MKKLPIEGLIEKLGFYGSKNLIYRDNVQTSNLSKHDIRTIQEINPFAIYLVDNKPFILFINSLFCDTRLKEISKKIWNAQIPVAILCDKNSVRIYNGKSIDFKTELLTEINHNQLETITDESEFSFYKISDPLFWDKHEKEYSKTLLNEYLLRNITSITDILKNKHEIKFATKLVLRLIFIRYLIDREVDLDYDGFNHDVIQSQKSLLDVSSDKERLYKLFQHLKDKFNGNLFELGSEINDNFLTPDVFELLSNFLSGDIDLGSGQMSLFAMYDFKIIPVELISNIYEILLGKEIRDKDNAFYTPNYLAEYILDKTTLEFLKTNKQYKILDPSCGSGIFLVNSFKRMIDINIGDSLFCYDDLLLKNTLENNIFGIDINEEAIDVTIFSLYLTILDYKDPKTLSCFKLPNLKQKNLIISDFFDDKTLENFKNIEFDFIIGNPPWGSVSDGMHLEYCKEHGHNTRQQNKEICRSFVFRAKDFSSKNTVCSFVLHSKILYTQKGPSKAFRQYLLQKTKILSIVEMSSVRKLVFKNANAPAAIVTFNYNENTNNLQNRITYTSMKPNMFFKLFNIIVVEKYDVKYVPQNLLFENDWAWKTIVYGFSKDIYEIRMLKKNFSTIAHIVKKYNLKSGTGIKFKGGPLKDSSSLIGSSLIEARAIDSFVINPNLKSKFNLHKIYNPKLNQQELFQAPVALMRKGFNPKSFKFRSYMSEISFLYPDAVTGISGTIDKIDILRSLTGLINSSLYAYLNLMLGSSSGIEREQSFPSEIFEYPVIESNIISEKVLKIQQTLEAENKQLFYDISQSTKLIKELDDCVMEQFGLINNNFIDYALNIQIPELTKSKEMNIYRAVTADELRIYAKCFIKEFKTIYNHIEKGICVKIYPEVLKRYAIFELEITENNQNNVETIINSVSNDNMQLFTRVIRHDYNEMFHQIRDVIHFTENSFYIIKPNNYKHWHPAIAEMDLTDVLDQILSDDGGEE